MTIEPQHHMAPLAALVKALHKGRTLEERFRRMRGRREGMRQAREANAAEAEAETGDLSSEPLNINTGETEETI